MLTVDKDFKVGALVEVSYKGYDFHAQIEGYRYVGSTIRLLTATVNIDYVDLKSFPSGVDGLSIVRALVNEVELRPLPYAEVSEHLLYKIKSSDKLKLPDGVVLDKFSRFTDTDSTTWTYEGAAPVHHQKQSLNNSCVSACIAMILNVPEEEIVDDFHKRYSEGMRVSKYLEELDVPHRLLYADDRSRASVEYAHLVTVVSLNRPGEFHLVVMLGTENGVSLILDPNRGRPGKKYYSTRADDIDCDKDAVLMTHYIPKIEIPIDFINSRY